MIFSKTVQKHKNRVEMNTRYPERSTRGSGIGVLSRQFAQNLPLAGESWQKRLGTDETVAKTIVSISPKDA
ncbi:hypothetical protein BST81_08460 [Leptolyngbya sp. 'hensonii']|nr:hypothetical protein BST81_08460 [Leptolyngbya sp. 'hensonii']